MAFELFFFFYFYSLLPLFDCLFSSVIWKIWFFFETGPHVAQVGLTFVNIAKAGPYLPILSLRL